MRVAWVTGASSGLGLHTAIALKSDGWQVVAGARSFYGQTGEDKMGYRIALDVTEPASIQKYFDQAVELFGTPDVLINCAAFLVLGAVEDISIDEYRSVMETNFFGQVSMTQIVLPLMRARGYGRIVNFSSINGLMGTPFQSAYTASKHAMEGFSECLAMEVAPYNIEIMLIEPGDHRSGGKAYRTHSQKKSLVYEETFLHAVSMMAHDEGNGSDPTKLGHKVMKILRKTKLPFRLCIGHFDQRLSTVLHDILSQRLFSRILRSHYSRTL